MSNIAMEINKVNSVSAIPAYYESVNKTRGHLGLSQAGHKCPRWLWYKHNGYFEDPIEGRVLQLFQLGNLLEQQLFFDFASAGFSITHDQKEVSFHDGEIRLRGHIDGIITGLMESQQHHLYECKSMNDKGFKRLLKNGYEAYNAQYKFQINAYALALELTNIFVVVYNKNDSTLYQERIKLKKEWIIEKLQDVFSAISGDIPDRACPRPDFWEAKWCNYYKECFNR